MSQPSQHSYSPHSLVLGRDFTCLNSSHTITTATTDAEDEKKSNHQSFSAEAASMAGGGGGGGSNAYDDDADYDDILMLSIPPAPSISDILDESNEEYYNEKGDVVEIDPMILFQQDVKQQHEQQQQQLDTSTCANSTHSSPSRLFTLSNRMALDTSFIDYTPSRDYHQQHHYGILFSDSPLLQQQHLLAHHHNHQQQPPPPHNRQFYIRRSASQDEAGFRERSSIFQGNQFEKCMRKAIERNKELERAEGKNSSNDNDNNNKPESKMSNDNVEGADCNKGTPLSDQGKSRTKNRKIGSDSSLVSPSHSSRGSKSSERRTSSGALTPSTLSFGNKSPHSHANRTISTSPSAPTQHTANKTNAPFAAFGFHEGVQFPSSVTPRLFKQHPDGKRALYLIQQSLAAPEEQTAALQAFHVKYENEIKNGRPIRNASTFFYKMIEKYIHQQQQERQHQKPSKPQQHQQRQHITKSTSIPNVNSDRSIKEDAALVPASPPHVTRCTTGTTTIESRSINKAVEALVPAYLFQDMDQAGKEEVLHVLQTLSSQSLARCVSQYEKLVQTIRTRGDSIRDPAKLFIRSIEHTIKKEHTCGSSGSLQDSEGSASGSAVLSSGKPSNKKISHGNKSSSCGLDPAVRIPSSVTPSLIDQESLKLLQSLPSTEEQSKALAYYDETLRAMTQTQTKIRNPRAFFYRIIQNYSRVAPNGDVTSSSAIAADTAAPSMLTSENSEPFGADNNYGLHPAVRIPDSVTPDLLDQVTVGLLRSLPSPEEQTKALEHYDDRVKSMSRRTIRNPRAFFYSIIQNYFSTVTVGKSSASASSMMDSRPSDGMLVGDDSNSTLNSADYPLLNVSNLRQFERQLSDDQDRSQSAVQEYTGSTSLSGISHIQIIDAASADAHSTELVKKLHDMTRQRDEADQRAEELSEKLASITTFYEERNYEFEAMERRLLHAMNEVSATKQQLAEKEAEITRQAQERISLELKLENLEVELRNLTAGLSKATEELRLEKETTRALKEVLNRERRQNGEISQQMTALNAAWTNVTLQRPAGGAPEEQGSSNEFDPLETMLQDVQKG